MDGSVGQTPTVMSGWCPGGKKRVSTALRASESALTCSMPVVIGGEGRERTERRRGGRGVSRWWGEV